MTKYNRKYANEKETAYRFEIFKNSILRASAKNMDEPDKPFGITKYSDLTPAEFESLFLRYHPDPDVDPRAVPVADLNRYDNQKLPSTFDWRNHKPVVISRVKNQGACGSCWAFSAVENVESVWALEGNHSLVNLSVQQVIDCDSNDGGCSGGDTKSAFGYIAGHGLELDSDYPYMAKDYSCEFQSDKVVARIDGFEFATHDRDEHAMQTYLANKAPLSICVDAKTWQDYKGGVVTRHCGDSLDHCVLITGYDTVSHDKPFWIIRNSWGEDWGEDGYIYIIMFEDKCGLAQEATSSYVN